METAAADLRQAKTKLRWIFNWNLIQLQRIYPWNRRENQIPIIIIWLPVWCACLRVCECAGGEQGGEGDGQWKRSILLFMEYGGCVVICRYVLVMLKPRSTLLERSLCSHGYHTCHIQLQTTHIYIRKHTRPQLHKICSSIQLSFIPVNCSFNCNHIIFTANDDDVSYGLVADAVAPLDVCVRPYCRAAEGTLHWNAVHHNSPFIEKCLNWEALERACKQRTFSAHHFQKLLIIIWFWTINGPAVIVCATTCICMFAWCE